MLSAPNRGNRGVIPGQATLHYAASGFAPSLLRIEPDRARCPIKTGGAAALAGVAFRLSGTYGDVPKINHTRLCPRTESRGRGGFGNKNATTIGS